jgi:hypothetical protein
MPKSLALSSKGLHFDEFMKAIVKVQPSKPKAQQKKKPKSRKAGR